MNCKEIHSLPKSLSDIEKYFIRRKQLELEKEKQLLAQRAHDKIVARERQEQQKIQEEEEAFNRRSSNRK